jgi:hypothetical protein
LAGEHRTGVWQQLPSFVKRAGARNMAARKGLFSDHPADALRFF